MINLCKIKYIAQDQVSQILLLTNDVTIYHYHYDYDYKHKENRKLLMRVVIIIQELI